MISAALAAQRDLTLEQLGSLADELAPLVRSQPCFGVTPGPRVSGGRFSGLLPGDRGHRRVDPHGQSDMNVLLRGLQPFRSGQKPQVCRAHLYYSQAARTCRSWCQWPHKPSGLQVLPPSRPSSRSSSPAPVLTEQEN